MQQKYFTAGNRIKVPPTFNKKSLTPPRPYIQGVFDQPQLQGYHQHPENQFIAQQNRNAFDHRNHYPHHQNMYEPQQLSQQKSYMNQKASHDQDFVSNSSYQYSTRLNNHVHQNFNYTPQNFKQVQFQQEKAQKQQKAQPQKLQNQLFDVPQITKNQKQRSPKKAQAGLQQEVTDGLNQMQYLQTPSSLMSNLPSIKSQKPNSLKKFEGDQPNLNQSNNHFSNKDQIMLEHSQQEFNNPSQSPKRRGRSPSPRKLQNQPSHDQETQNKQAPSKKTRTSKSAGQMPTLLTRFELGRILSSGMIGIVYVARDRFYANQTWSSLYCIKRMYKSKIVEKHLMTSTVKEIEILLKVRKIKGCIQLIELIQKISIQK